MVNAQDCSSQACLLQGSAEGHGSIMSSCHSPSRPTPHVSPRNRGMQDGLKTSVSRRSLRAWTGKAYRESRSHSCFLSWLSRRNVRKFFLPACSDIAGRILRTTVTDTVQTHNKKTSYAHNCILMVRLFYLAKAQGRKAGHDDKINAYK